MEWLKTFFRKHIVGDLPGDMDRCGYCNNVACSESHFESCPNRLKGIRPETDRPEA